MGAKGTKIVTSVDIGTTKVVAMAAQVTDGKVNILGFGSAVNEGVKRGVVANIEGTTQAIKEAVAKAEAQSGVTFKNVFVGIAGQHIKNVKRKASVNTIAPDGEVTQQDVDELMDKMYSIDPEADVEVVHVTAQNYTVSGDTVLGSPVGTFGPKLEGIFHIIKANVGAVKNIKKCINRAGLDLNSLMLEPLASADAVLTEEEKIGGVVLVDIGGGTIDVAVYYGGVLRHAAIIPFGGSVITQDIETEFHLLPKTAEKLKVKFGHAFSECSPNIIVTVPGVNGRPPKEINAKLLSFVIEARMKQLLDGICYEIEESGFTDKIALGIVFTGGGSMLKDLDKLTSYLTGYDVRVAAPVNIENKENIKLSPIHSTGAGLVISGSKIDTVNEDSFFTKDRVKGVKKSSNNFLNKIKNYIGSIKVDAIFDE